MVTKEELQEILKTVWGEDLQIEHFYQSARKGVFAFRQGGKWKLSKATFANPKSNIMSSLGNMDFVEVLNNGFNEIYCGISYVKHRKQHERNYIVGYNGENAYLDMKVNKNYADYLESKMNDFRAQDNFLDICEFMNVDPSGTDEEVAAGLALMQYDYEYNPPSSGLEDADIQFNVEAVPHGVEISMLLLNSNGEPLDAQQPLMSFAPRGNDFNHRWRGDAEFTKTMLITTDLRNRDRDALYLIAEEEDDLTAVEVYGKCVAFEDDGTVRSFSKRETFDLSEMLETYNYLPR